MLEKIGLPPKPSLKGNEWVLDASHCQGCSSAFTFFNRKHHCRRCGGIFCGSCTQQRMMLRGQGDAPVRICDPCKKLEDAARFELRYGQRNKAPKGNSKPSLQMQEVDSLLKEVMSNEAGSGSSISEPLSDRQTLQEIDGTAIEEEVQNVPQATPEMLLEQAEEHKQQWLSLKREGKTEEALQAFKRRKELERQAEQLKLSLRRGQKRATNSAIARKEKTGGSERKQKAHALLEAEKDHTKSEKDVDLAKPKRSLKEHEEKDDLLSALRDIGWSDADLHDAGTKQNKAKGVENELAELVASIHPADGKSNKGSISSMGVLAHKRRALALKREGNLTEAKEELKKAKVLERELEEQEFVNMEESDDELSALIRGLEKESSIATLGSVDVDMTSLSGLAHFEREDDDDRVELSDSDMNDPEMIAALRSMGWEEEALAMQERSKAENNNISKQEGNHPARSKRSIKPSEEGSNVFEIGTDDNVDGVHVTDEDMNDPYFLSSLKAMGFAEEETSKLVQPLMASFSKHTDKKNLQQEILFLKKEAVALKRAGKLQEAKEELRQAKLLEKELQHLQPQHVDEEDIVLAFSAQDLHVKDSEPSFEEAHVMEEDTSVDVTDEDIEDPELVNSLKSLGWQDDSTSEGPIHSDEEIKLGKTPLTNHHPKSKPELQKELLGIKRAALKLRREGKLEEAEIELEKASQVEQLIKELESLVVGVPNQVSSKREERGKNNSVYAKKDDNVTAPGHIPSEVEDLLTGAPWLSTKQESEGNDMFKHLQGPEIGPFIPFTLPKTKPTSTGIDEPKSFENKNLVTTKDIEASTSASQSSRGPTSLDVDKPSLLPQNEVKVDFSSPLHGTHVSGSRQPEQIVALGTSFSVDPLQQEILGYKRKALALKREGRLEDAKEQLSKAKLLEKKLVQAQAQSETSAVESFLPSQLGISGDAPKTEQKALSSMSHDRGLHDRRVGSTSGPSMTPSKKHAAGKDRLRLQRESLAHKRKALALRREGKMEQAETEFELAKSLEKQMEELGGGNEGNGPLGGHHEKEDVEDLFDPQLLAMLKGIGWKDTDIFQQDLRADEHEAKKTMPMEASKPSAISPNEERVKLEEKIKSEKIRAVQLKRAGRQAEALDALHAAKHLEKRLQSM